MDWFVTRVLPHHAASETTFIWVNWQGQERGRFVEVTLDFHKNVELDKELVFEDPLWTTDTDDVLPRFKTLGKRGASITKFGHKSPWIS